MTRTTETMTIDDLLALSAPEPNTGCWLWLLSTRDHGYGQLAIDGTVKLAHRIAWSVANRSPVPHGLFVCHRCDVRICINPDHLFLGTHAENMRDCSRKRRIAAGESHTNARLSLDQVLAMRARFDAGESVRVVARDFGVSKINARRIRDRKAWVQA